MKVWEQGEVRVSLDDWINESASFSSSCCCVGYSKENVLDLSFRENDMLGRLFSRDKVDFNRFCNFLIMC